MGRIIVKSFFEDIKNFKNMIPYRIQKINEAENKPLPQTYGVNELSSKLHPKKQKVVISSAFFLDNKTKILILSSRESKSLAYFRAGQGVNIKINSYTTFFPLLSSPDEKDYKIVVFADFEDVVSKYLFSQPENTELEISGPEGLFYYSSLRDKNSLVFICDIFGTPPVISICKSLIKTGDNTEMKVILLNQDENCNVQNLFEAENISVDVAKNIYEVYEKTKSNVCAPSSFFVSGKQELCNEATDLFSNFKLIRGRIRLYVANPFQRADLPEYRYNCSVIYRDKTFEFECTGNETLLSAFERSNIPTQAKCKVGECGYCRCKLLDGEVEILNCNDIDSRRSADEKYGFVHPCRAFAKSDLTLVL